MLIDFVYFELGIGTTEQEGRIGIRTQTWHSSHLCLAWLSSKGSYHCNNPWRRCLSRSWLCSRPKRLLLVLWNKQDSRAFPTAKGCVGNHIYEPTVTIGGTVLLSALCLIFNQRGGFSPTGRILAWRSVRTLCTRGLCGGARSGSGGVTQDIFSAYA